MLYKIESAVLSVVVFAAAATQAKASQVFDFSFSNTIGNVSGTVNGKVVLPFNGNGTGAASDVLIESVPSALNPVDAAPFSFDATSWAGQIINTFTVTNGQILSAEYEADQYGPNPPEAYEAIQLNFTGNNELAYTPSVYAVSYQDVRNENGIEGLNFSPAATPEPSSLTLLGTCLLAISGRVYRRWRRAAGPVCPS